MALRCVRFSTYLNRVARVASSVTRHNPILQSKAVAASRVISPVVSSEIRRNFTSTSLMCRKVFDPETDEIGPDTILFEGCDYNHWLITMDFPRDNPPPREEMIETYVNTAAKIFGSVEEAKKKIYALSTTTYQGFQVQCSEETSEKFKDLPGVVFVLPDSYIDPVNKEYGGDKYVNGEIFPRPPPVHYGTRPNRRRDQNYGPRQQQNYQYQQPPQQNYGSPQQHPNQPYQQQNYRSPQQYQNQPPQQHNYNIPQQSNYGPPQQQNYEPPQQQNYGPPQQQNYGSPQQPNHRPPPPQQSYGPPPQQNYNPSQPPNYGQPPRQNYGTPQQQQNYAPPPPQQSYGTPSQHGNVSPQQPSYGNMNSGPQQSYGAPFERSQPPSYHGNMNPAQHGNRIPQGYEQGGFQEGGNFETLKR